MDYIETWKEVIQRPSDFFRKMPETGGYADPLTFAAISYIIYGLLSGLFSRGMMGGMYGYSGVREFGFSTAIMTAIMAPIMGIICLLYTSDAADDLTRVDLGGCRIIKK